MTPKEKAKLIFDAAQIEENEVFALRGTSRIFLGTALVVDGRTVGITRDGDKFEAVDVTDDKVFQINPTLLYGGE